MPNRSSHRRDFLFCEGRARQAAHGLVQSHAAVNLVRLV